MVLAMNKSDIKLVIILLLIIICIFIVIGITREDGSMAEVYYEDELVLTIDLNTDGEYTIDGELGDVVLEVKDKMVRVKEENSPKHICSREGFIGDSSRTLICLPNKVIVKVVGESDIDGVVY